MQLAAGIPFRRQQHDADGTCLARAALPLMIGPFPMGAKKNPENFHKMGTECHRC